jgi:tRNA threonylcarbamoyladenosine biosynthesis protein TsaE
VGDIVVLRGEVGAGKTTLVRAIARALGVDEPVTSPTYTLANRYLGRVPLLHIDAYRVADPDDEELGLVLDGADAAITFVEWPDALGDAVAAARVTVDLEHRGPRERLVRLTSGDVATSSALSLLVDDLRARYLHP